MCLSLLAASCAPAIDLAWLPTAKWQRRRHLPHSQMPGPPAVKTLYAAGQGLTMVEAYGEQVVDKTLESCQAEAAAVEDSLDLAPGAAASVSALLSRHLSRRCALVRETACRASWRMCGVRACAAVRGPQATLVDQCCHLPRRPDLQTDFAVFCPLFPPTQHPERPSSLFFSHSLKPK